jgi:hypothetical protein
VAATAVPFEGSGDKQVIGGHAVFASIDMENLLAMKHIMDFESAPVIVVPQTVFGEGLTIDTPKLHLRKIEIPGRQLDALRFGQGNNHV